MLVELLQTFTRRFHGLSRPEHNDVIVLSHAAERNHRDHRSEWLTDFRDKYRSSFELYVCAFIFYSLVFISSHVVYFEMQFTINAPPAPGSQWQPVYPGAPDVTRPQRSCLLSHMRQRFSLAYSQSNPEVSKQLDAPGKPLKVKLHTHKKRKIS